MIFDHFDRIRIVNLPERSDRRREMNRELARYGLDRAATVEFFPAVRGETAAPFYSKGARGSFLSHRAILAEAAAAGESVLILEDDCDFLPAVAAYQVPGEFDVFYGGYFASDPTDLENSDIVGGHFMGFSARAAEAVTRYFADFTEPVFQVDARAASEPGYDPTRRPAVDGAYVWFRRAHPDMRTVFAMLSLQRPSRTDVGSTRLFDRIPLVREAANWARRARNHATGPRDMKHANVVFGAGSK